MKVTTFKSGAIRDDQSGKFDFAEYFSPLALARFSLHMQKNAKKYGTGNWRKGIPTSSALRSKRRHAWLIDMQEYGIRLEEETDHYAGEMFNMMIKMHEEELTKIKRLKKGETLYGYTFDNFDEAKTRNNGD